MRAISLKPSQVYCTAPVQIDTGLMSEYSGTPVIAVDPHEPSTSRSLWVLRYQADNETMRNNLYAEWNQGRAWKRRSDKRPAGLVNRKRAVYKNGLVTT